MGSKDDKYQAELKQDGASRRGTVRLGSPTTAEKARAAANSAAQNRPHGSSDTVTVRKVS